MKITTRFTAFIAAVVLLFSVMVGVSAESYSGTINADNVFFRQKPNTNAIYYAQLKINTKVTVTGTSGDFYAVTYNGQNGYVMKKYVTLSSSGQKALTQKASTSKYASVTSISKLGTPPDYTSKGSSGEDVEKLQQALKIKGYYSDTVDGKFGSGTEKAVKAYQKAMNLSQTGKADYATIMKLFGSVAYTTAANDPAMKGISSISQITVPGYTSKGSSGKDVLALQQALKIKGFYKDPIDSKYGDKTVAAVKAYQKSVGIEQTGKADYATVMKLFGKVAGTTAADDPAMKGITSISQIAVPDYTSKGASGKNVLALQQALKIKGFYKDPIDSKYGDKTVAAVKAYQKSVGIEQTGKADYATIMKLFGTVQYTSVSNDPKMNGITAISQITVPSTSSKGASGKDVLALQQALKIKGYYKAPIDSKYSDATVAAVKAYQKANGLTQDGIAGNSTIKKLFGKNAANYTFTTERLDWFNGGCNIIPKGAIFTVKDVATGRTFKCRRWSGYNHMDSEPLTSSDTATMKSIYGGAWSWNRRAILVQYNGHVYAASMNGMPHGTSTLNNNFDGHFCIHFYNSRTHETNRVDSAHQNAVARAMNAVW